MSSIRQRPNGTWRARYRDDDGREHARHFDLKRDAQAWLDEIASSRLTGSYVAPAAQKTTLAEFYAEWVEHQLWAENTRRKADNAIGKCSFRDVPFGKLRRSHAEAHVKAITTDLAPSSVRTRVAYLRIVLRAAVADRKLASDPLEGVKLPAVRKTAHTMRIPTGAEVAKIRAEIAEEERAFVDVMAYAGLRIGEACGLQLPDVAFLGARTIHVERQVQNLPGRLDVGPPKHGSERAVPAPDELLLRLSRHVEMIGVQGDDQWLFGRPPSPDTLRRHFMQAAARAGVDDITPHDLRHFYASGLIAAGLDPVAVSRALGHASAAITLRVYAHLWPDAADRTRAAAASLMTSAADSADSSRTAGA